MGPEVGGQLVDGGVEGGGGGAVAPEGVDSFGEDGARCEGCCGGVGGEGDYGEGGLGAVSRSVGGKNERYGRMK